MSKFPVEASGFKLYQRARHVFSEALRVQQFKNTCQDFAGKECTEEDYKVRGARWLNMFQSQ
jgi:galactokinase